MSSARDRLRQKNAKIRDAQAAGNPAAPSSSRVRTTPVRVTVDLPPAAHAALLQWCSQTAADLGRARLPHAEVLRALVDQLGEDPDLAETIRNRIHGSQ